MPPHEKMEAIGISCSAADSDPRGSDAAPVSSHLVTSPSRPPDDPFAHTLDPVLIELADEFSRRTLSGEAVDVDELIAAHPEKAEAFRKILPILQGLAELEPADAENGEADVHRPTEGKSFADFHVIREIGRGGMGIVYEARQASLGRTVALKILHLAVAVDPRAVTRFQLEAQVVGLLQHPNIVPIHAVGTFDDIPYFAMRYIEGGSLAGVISELRALIDRGTDNPGGASCGDVPSALAVGLLTDQFAHAGTQPDIDRRSAAPLTEHDHTGPVAPRSIGGRSFHRNVARLGCQTASALAYAHDQGIVHRDIKPANLLLDRRGDVWVADFGMADVQGNPGLTTTGDLPGTLRYMSPEQVAGKRALIDRRTDIYSLGATLYRALDLAAGRHRLGPG